MSMTFNNMVEKRSKLFVIGHRVRLKKRCSVLDVKEIT